MTGNLRKFFWPDVKNKSVEKIDAPLVRSLPITEKDFYAGISVLIPGTTLNTTENSSLMTEYLLYAGISPDSEITGVKPA